MIQISEITLSIDLENYAVA